MYAIQSVMYLLRRPPTGKTLYFGQNQYSNGVHTGVSSPTQRHRWPPFWQQNRSFESESNRTVRYLESVYLWVPKTIRILKGDNIFFWGGSQSASNDCAQRFARWFKGKDKYGNNVHRGLLKLYASWAFFPRSAFPRRSIRSGGLRIRAVHGTARECQSRSRRPFWCSRCIRRNTRYTAFRRNGRQQKR